MATYDDYPRLSYPAIEMKELFVEKVDVALSRTLDLLLLSLSIQRIDALDRSAILAGAFFLSFILSIIV